MSALLRMDSMYNGYIIECPSMCNLYWAFVGIEYPDEPEELHVMSKSSLNKLNKHLQAINIYLQEIANSDDVWFNDFESFSTYVLDNYPSHIDRNVLDIYLGSIEGLSAVIASSFRDDVILLDSHGSTAVIME